MASGLDSGPELSAYEPKIDLSGIDPPTLSHKLYILCFYLSLLAYIKFWSPVRDICIDSYCRCFFSWWFYHQQRTACVGNVCRRGLFVWPKVLVGPNGTKHSEQNIFVSENMWHICITCDPRWKKRILTYYYYVVMVQQYINTCRLTCDLQLMSMRCEWAW